MNKEDLKIGMYVRTKNNSYIPSEIAQIIKMDDKYIYLDIDKDSNVVWEYPEYIEKASFNVIDLIEIGDYVNGYKVEEVNNNLNEHKGTCNCLDTYLWCVNDLDKFEEIVIFENEIKIRKLLGKEYHLCTSVIFINSTDYITEWELFKKYDDTNVYFSKDNKSIMDSKHNTEEELLEFAKTHHEIDEYMAMRLTRIIILWLVYILSITNIFISKKEIRSVCLTVDLVLLFETVISSIIWNHNLKVRMGIFRENFRKINNNE